MPTIMTYAQGSFAGNRLGVRAPPTAQMPGLQLWWFPRISLGASPNQAPNGPPLVAVGGGGTFQPTYVSMPGSQTTAINFETSIPDAANATLMCVARTSAPARVSSMIASAPGTAPNNGSEMNIYNVGSAMGMFSPPVLSSNTQISLDVGATQPWGFYAMRVQSGAGITGWAKTNGKTANYPSASAHTVGTATYRIGMMNPTIGSNNAALDIAFVGIVSGATAGSALADALVEQCYQSVKYGLSFDGITI